MWGAIEPQKRLVAILAVMATLAAIFGLARAAGSPTNALLYAGLEPGDAGQVISSLEAQAVTYEVRGDSIYVPSDQRDVVRMTLAAAGLPSNGAAGYELLDTLSGFSTTSQMFDAAYWRAKEGELARTITASSVIRAARVHIAANSQQPFARDSHATASVTVTTTGGALATAQAEAIRYLVASAVAGLDPQDVALIDSARGLVLSGGAGSANTAGEIDPRAAAMRSNVERLLAARVGPGNAIVELTVDVISSQETVSERIIDPNSSTAISQEAEKSTASSTGSGAAGGAVTVASNLPDTTATGTGGSTESNTTREATNYDLSETRRETLRPAGDIKRLSVAVLINDIVAVNPDGLAIFTPRDPAEIENLRLLVQSAVGFDAARGDVVTIAAMPFSQPTALGSLATSGGVLAMLASNLMTLVQLGILALVALILGLFVIRPVLTRPAPLSLPPNAPENGEAARLTYDAPAYDAPAQTALETLPPPDPMAQLRAAMAERSEDSTRLLRSWIEAPESEESLA